MRKEPVILFTCRPEDEGVIAPPVPAKSLRYTITGMPPMS